MDKSTWENPKVKTPDSLRAGGRSSRYAAPTLRYGPAGDSAPTLRLKALVWPKGSFRPGKPGPTPLFPS